VTLSREPAVCRRTCIPLARGDSSSCLVNEMPGRCSCCRCRCSRCWICQHSWLERLKWAGWGCLHLLQQVGGCGGEALHQGHGSCADARRKDTQERREFIEDGESARAARRRCELWIGWMCAGVCSWKVRAYLPATRCPEPAGVMGEAQWRHLGGDAEGWKGGDGRWRWGSEEGGCRWRARRR
jgi:hypothetical protein